MKKNTFFKKISQGIVALLMIHSCQSPLVQEEEFISDLSLKGAAVGQKSYIIQLDDKTLASELSGLANYHQRKAAVNGKALGLLKRNGIVDGQLAFVYSNSIVGFSVKIAPGQAKKLMSDQSVKSIREDRVITLAPPPGKGKPGGDEPVEEPSAQDTPWGIERIGGAGDGTGKTAWIIDTGIDLDHPDLNVDATKGFSAFDKGKDASFDDGNGHGSHVAGTVAARDNLIGVVGVAAGATVVPVKVLNSRGSGSYAGVIAGVDWVAANASAGDVANMSLGGPVDQDLDDAVIAAASGGVLFVLAAGNEGDDADKHSPARANGKNIYTISAMDNQDRFAYFSNYGAAVDFCAPGVSIASTYKNGAYATLSGTSMAAPHVAGLALLGNISSDGVVANDPDGNPDPIAHR